MKTITFIRHGQSVANAGGITVPHDSIALSPLGHLQARTLADSLDLVPSRVLVSTFSRTYETAKPFCQRVGIDAEAHALLDEFSSIDPALLIGMNGAQRRPIAEAYWDEADPSKRMGAGAETFDEFDSRVSRFLSHMDELADRTVIFGHGIWFGLLVWKMLGFTANGTEGMRRFRRFQIGLPLPNCVKYSLAHNNGRSWSLRVDDKLLRRLATVV